MSANLANQSGQLTLRRDVKFNGVKVFSATMVADRDQLGEKVTAWMANHGHLKVTDVVVTQSPTRRSTASRSRCSTGKTSSGANRHATLASRTRSANHV